MQESSSLGAKRPAYWFVLQNQRKDTDENRAFPIRVGHTKVIAISGDGN
jgi:hypothetical protein